MPHFFIPPENISEENFIISGEEVHHLINVRRCKIGSIINIFDGTGKTYIARIDSVDNDEIKGVIINESLAHQVSVKIKLYQSVPKGDRFDWIVEKAAELGVHTIIPIICERSVLKEISDNKIDRWRRVSNAACQQCKRADLMNIEKPVNFISVVDSLRPEEFNIIPWEAEETKSIENEFIKRMPISNANIIIGPEGGFSINEIKIAQQNGVIPVTLGKRILRVETASLLSVVLVLNVSGEYL